MAANLYESIMTRNAGLAKFSDEHPNIAGVMMKVINYLYAYSQSRHKDLKGEIFECLVAPDGKTIIIKIKD